MARFRILLLLILVLTFSVGITQAQTHTTSNSVGLVVLGKSYSNEDFIQIYNEDGSIWYRFTYYYDDSDGKFEYANSSFRPFAFHPDYFLLVLKCVRKQAGRYEVIVNEETGLLKYVKADGPSLRFERWERHILKVFAIGFDQKVNPIRESPQGRVKTTLTANAPFHPVEVRGEWLRVRWMPISGAGEYATRYASGWIRWKTDQKLLVELFYIS